MDRERRNHRFDSGFTLLELVLVLLVVGMGLAMVAPSLRGFLAGSRVTEAADQVVALTRLARSQAVAEATVYRLNFSPQDRAYWLTFLDGQEFSILGNEMGRFFRLPDEATLEILGAGGSLEGIHFYPDGRADLARIRITGVHGEEFLIASRSPAEELEVIRPEEEEAIR